MRTFRISWIYLKGVVSSRAVFTNRADTRYLKLACPVEGGETWKRYLNNS